MAELTREQEFDRWWRAGHLAMRSVGSDPYSAEQIWNAAWDMALRACDALEVAKDAVRLREIEHLAWHLLDDSEENAQTGEITIHPLRDDYDKLSALLPEDHPDAALCGEKR